MTRLRRSLLLGHRWLGLLLALPLLLVAASGALLAAGKPLDEWLNRHLFQTATATSAAPAVDAVHAALRQRYGEDAGFTLRLPQQPGDSLRVFVRASGFSGMAFYDPASAAWLGQRGDVQGWWPWLFELHSELLLGDTGKGLLSISAAGMLLLVLAGGVLGWPRRGGAGLRVAWRAPAPRLWRDAHRVGGLLLLPLVLAIVASGVYMAWTPVRGWVSQALGETPAKPPRLPIQAADASSPSPPLLSTIVAAATRPWPEGRVVYVTLRHGQPLRVRVRLPHDPHPNGLSSAWFDPRDGRELARVRVEQLDTGQRWVSWIYPLHSAQLLGPVQPMVWVLAGAALLTLAGSGVWLWWKRRQVSAARQGPTPGTPRSA
jgi:uncharacterized iron-regulated membrane protein